MKSKNILDAMNDIDFDMVEDAMSKPRRRAKTRWIRYGILAACFGLLISLLIGIPFGLYHNGENDTVTNEDIGDLLDPNEPVPDPPNQYPIYGGEEVLPQFPFPEDYQLILTESQIVYLGFYEEGVTYTFSSADESIVKVNEYGIVESVGVGETTITMTAENAFGTSSIVIHVLSMGPWQPITPTDFEWWEIENTMPFNADMRWHHTYMSPTSKYNIHGTVFGEEGAGPIYILNDELIATLTFVVKDDEGWEEDCFEKTDDMYLDIYFYEHINGMDDYRRYEKVTLPIKGMQMTPGNGLKSYLCVVNLYEAMGKYFKENAIFRTSMVLRKGDTRLLYGADGFKCAGSMMAYIEYALAHPDEIEV